MKTRWKTLDDTEAFAKTLARRLENETVTILLEGDLGAGKTAWTRFFGQALGVRRTINSPTFTIMKSYRTANGRTLYHIDAYRLEGASADLGFEECFEDGLCVVEWPQYILDVVPEDHLTIRICENEDLSRDVEVLASGPDSQKILEDLSI